MKRKAQLGTIAIGIIVILSLGILTCMLGFDKVNASHIGVKDRFGVIKGTMKSGMQWTGLFTHVEQYDLRLRKLTVEMLTAEQTSTDVDGQTVKARIEVNYRLNPDHIQDAYTKIGRDRALAQILNIDGIIREGFKSTTSKYKSKEIWQQRQAVKDQAITIIKQNFPADYFLLENVIISDLDFNPDFIAAIELQKTNEELALAAEKAVDIAKYDANKAIEMAIGKAESQKKQAEATAYTKRVTAEAEAYGRLAIAQSEAEALRLKRLQLNEDVLRQSWIEAWQAGGSQVPKWITGDSGQQFLVAVE